MIDDKKIEEAATVASISDTEKGRVREGYAINALADHENGFREGYIEGAKWAISEFLKDLWHPVSEEPKREAQRTYILGKTRASESGVLPMLLRQNTDWKEFPILHGVTRWLYIDDLFPKKGGEK